jgi:uncharacterized membrane protein
MPHRDWHAAAHRFRQGELRLTRIEALSDGVFAIVVTLLVLELKVPALTDHASVSELAHALVDLPPKFVSWLISFIIVCKFWLNHHHILGLARHADYATVWLNSLFLLGQSFIPFPTALAGEYPTNPLAVSFFGFVFALNAFLFPSHQAKLAAIQDPRIEFRCHHTQGDLEVWYHGRCMKWPQRGHHGKPHRTTKILSHARWRGGRVAARGARAAARRENSHDRYPSDPALAARRHVSTGSQ